MFRPAALLVLGAVFTALAACAGAGLSKPTFLSRADHVCRADSDAFGAITKPADFSGLADSSTKLAATATTQQSTLRRLAVPSSDRVAVQAVLDGLGATAASAKALGSAANTKKDSNVAKATSDMTTQARMAGDKARAYGFAECGLRLQSATATVADGARTIVKQDYIATVSEICRQASKENNKLGEPRSFSEMKAYAESILAINGKAEAQIRAVAAPPGDEAAIGAIIAAQDSLLAKYRAVRAAAESHDGRSAVALAKDLDVLGAQQDSLADGYGLKYCGTSRG